MSGEPRVYPMPTDDAMALLVYLIEKRGAQLKVAETGKLLIRDREHNLTPDDRAVVEHYRIPLADWLQRTAATQTESDEIQHQKKENSTEGVDGCRRCGSTQFVEVPVHDGASVRRDCAKCRTTKGFPIWHGETAEATT